MKPLPLPPMAPRGLHLLGEANGSVVNVMKQSGWEVPEWMNDLPKWTKRDKRRMRQRMVKRKDVDAASRPEKKGKPKKS